MIILSYGTFSIAPKLWTQVFIISVQVSEGVYIPVCFALLPDKKHSTCDAMFGMLREALENRGLELSAEYFMSDFETATRDFLKAIISKVQQNGFKSDYTSGNCPDFSAFIRAILGLGYVPLPRFREGIRNLYVLAKRLTGPQRSFAKKMIDYISKYWVNGSYHLETWVMFQHDGETTNNHSEGYNSHLNPM